MFGSDVSLPMFITLNNPTSTTMKLRNTPKVLRVHKSHKKKGYEELYSELLLFYPWRNEEEDLHCNSGEKCTSLFNDKLEVIGDQNVHIMHKKDEHTYENGDVLELSVLDI